MKLMLVLFAFVALFASEAANLDSLVNSENCVRTDKAEEILRSSEFNWGMSLEEIKEKQDEVYKKGYRLKDRAFIENGVVYLPMKPFMNDEKRVRLSERFIKSVIGHVENGLKRNYVDAIIFPDMGHSHFFVDKKFYKEKVSPIPVKERHKAYELMINHPETRFLYHTAEQLDMKKEDGSLKEDRHLQWRFFTRNLVGHNKAQGKIELLHNEGHKYNTARDYDEGFRYWGAGFNLSASKNGCFAYKHNGKTLYFDLSLKDLEP